MKKVSLPQAMAMHITALRILFDIPSVSIYLCTYHSKLYVLLCKIWKSYCKSKMAAIYMVKPLFERHYRGKVDK